MRIVLGLSIIGALWMCGLLVRFAIPEQTKRADHAQAFEVFETKASASLTGEFRSSLSGYLWAKTDEYLHSGVHMRPMTEREKAQGAREASNGDEIGHHHHDETGAIPEPERDPRGVWGELERQVKPYFDVRGHMHRDSRETLPLFRFMTWADPTFVPGYVVGAQVILFADETRLDEALAFLREGLRYNPNSITLNTEYARHLIVKRAAYAEAENYLKRAIQTGNSSKPADWEREGFQDAYRWMVLQWRKRGNRQQELYWAREGLKRFPDDGICLRALRANQQPVGQEDRQPHEPHD